MGFWEPLFFWFFAFGALATSCAVIVVRNPLYCALLLIADFFCFAGLYVLLSAHFLAVVQVLVYGGAIMVLFLFIIMLLNQRGKNLVANRFQVHYVIAIIAGLVMFLFSAGVIVSAVNLDNVSDSRDCIEWMAEVDDADDLDADDEERYQGCVATVGPEAHEQPRKIATAIDGLYADVEEETVEAEYRQTLRAWEDGTQRPSDGTYPRFDEDREYELPPSLQPDPDIDQVTPGRDGLYGTFMPVSIMLVNRFVIPFELTAVLLLAAIIGAVILAKRRVT